MTYEELCEKLDIENDIEFEEEEVTMVNAYYKDWMGYGFTDEEALEHLASLIEEEDL